ncbi:MAG: response regulator, partial [Candidatus Latescibacterota bacterium]
MEFAKSVGAKKRILLLDHDRASFDTVKNTFSGSEYRIEKAVDGEGFETVQGNPPDLIIADMKYQPLPGADLLNRLRDANLTIPVIITGGEPRDAVTAFRLGAADFLEKPLDSAELGERLPTAFSAQADTLNADEKKLAGMVAEIEREKKEMHDLLRISASLNISSDSKDILKRLTDLAAESMHCEAASIMLINSREKALEFVVATGDKGQKLET